MNISKKIIISIVYILIVLAAVAQTKRTPQEDDYYKIITLPTPEGMLLEVGGVTTLPDGRIAVCTRRGDVWIVENPTMQNGTTPEYQLFASGLHEPLGLIWHEGSLYAAQRGELTKLTDKNGDDKADVLRCSFCLRNGCYDDKDVDY